MPKLKDTLHPETEDPPLVVQDGKKTIDVHTSSESKGIAIMHWLKESPTHDFIMIAGDDTTDEDIFKAAPDNAFTSHVGTNKTTAKLVIHLKRLCHTLVE